jgi:fibronectin-binding autotransporter adhesin
MAITTSNVNTTTDSFLNWVDKTNTLLDAYSTSIITTAANSTGGFTTGNATVNGVFSANSITVQGNSTFGLRGGNVTSGGVLYITGNVSIGNATVNTTINSTTFETDLAFTVTGATTLSSTLAVSGATTISGNSTLSGSLQTISGNANFDSGVLFVDATNNKVGVNDTTPTSTLDVTGNAAISSTLYVEGVITSNGGAVVNGQVNIIGEANATSGFRSGTVGSSPGLLANSTTILVGNSTANVITNANGVTSQGTSTVSPASNTSGTGLGTTSKRWNLVANTGDFSGNLAITTVLANAGLGTATQVLTSGGSGANAYWADAGVLVAADTANSTRYVPYVQISTGQATTVYVRSDNFTYNPNTGVVSATEFSATSDIRVKQDILTITNALETVSQLRGVSYKIKDSGLDLSLIHI